MKKTFVLLLSFLALNVFGQTSSNRFSTHYPDLQKLSPLPVEERNWMDTISFPWSEYSRAALAHSLIKPYYITNMDQETLTSFVSVPANSSDQTRGELEYLLQLQRERNPEQIARAEAIASIGSSPLVINPTDSSYQENLHHLFYIAAPVGSWYNPENFPATTRLLMNCIQDIRATEFYVKRYFRRPRPYHLEPTLEPLARIGSPAFASGHSLWAYSQALVFSEIIPSKRKLFLERAAEVRWSRELMGIHFPSDNEASITLSRQLLRYWFNNPGFVADLEQAKQEWSTRNKNFK